MTDQPYIVREPAAEPVPLLVSIPHTGVDVPADIAARFASPAVAALPDTDRHLHDLYDFVPQLGAKTIYARYSRYVVDLNRPTSRRPLYPGKKETALVPRRTFALEPIYAAGDEPGEAEIEARTAAYWQPYHDRLAAELAALQDRFGYALLFDAHSVKSFVPMLHPEPLPELILGDVDGRSADAAVSEATFAVLSSGAFDAVRNVRFRGGHITRRYGKPEAGVHALQLEMVQRLYMDEDPPFAYRPDLAAKLRPLLEATLRAIIAAPPRPARR